MAGDKAGDERELARALATRTEEGILLAVETSDGESFKLRMSDEQADVLVGELDELLSADDAEEDES